MEKEKGKGKDVDKEKNKGKDKEAKGEKKKMKMFGKWREKLEDREGSAPPAIVPSAAVLGVSLEKALERCPSHDGIPLPALVRCCIDYIEKHGLLFEGIYRLSCPKSQLDDLESAWNSGLQPDFEDPHQATGLLKRFFRQLASPVFPNLATLESLAEHCNCVPITACRCPVSRAIRTALGELPEENFMLAAYLFIHAQHEHDNKMSLAALGVLLQTVLGVSKRLVCVLILNACDCLPVTDPEIVFLFNDISIQS